MPLEILNRALVFLCGSLAFECAEIFSFAASRIFLAGIQPILAGLQFPNHKDFFGACTYAHLALVVAPLNIRSALETRAC